MDSVKWFAQRRETHPSSTRYQAGIEGQLLPFCNHLPNTLQRRTIAAPRHHWLQKPQRTASTTSGICR